MTSSLKPVSDQATLDAACTEQAFRDGEERLRCVIELSSDYFWEQDTEHRFTLVRHRETRGSETDPCGFLGKTMAELGGRPVEGTWSAHEALREAREEFTGFVLHFSDWCGQERYLSMSGRPIFDGCGHFRGYRGVATDVTRETRNERLLALERDVSRALVNTEDPNEGVRIAIRKICEHEGWEAGQYWALDRTTWTMRLQVGWCVDDAHVRHVAEQARGIAFEPGVGLVGITWRSGEPMWVEDLAEETRLMRKDIARQTGWRNAFLFPVLVKRRVVGVLDFSARCMKEPDARLLQLFHTLGTQVGHYYEQALTLEQLRDSEERYYSTIELAAIGISHVNGDGRFIHANRRLCDMLGYSREELLELTVKDISHPDDVAVTDRDTKRIRAGEIESFIAEKRYLRKDGTPIWVRITVAPKPGPDGRPQYDISVVEDISERKRAEERVQYLATHDELTNLPNRTMFSQLLDHAVESSRHTAREFAVLFIDLDRFKIVNDSLGHEAGDLLLKTLASRLKRCIRDSDVIARLGGDEFVVLVDDITAPAQASQVARGLQAAALKPIQIMGQECRVTASVGIAMYPKDASEGRSLMKHADMAMYAAKEEGKNNIQFYSREIQPLSIDRLALETSLSRALEREEFSLHYQAKVDLESNAITGTEALLRWWNHELGSVPPGQFISLAEDTGLIVPIGKWVLRAACKQNVAWQRQGLPPIRIAVNLSPRQFKDPDLLGDIVESLAETGMSAEQLELEITESMIMSNVDHAIERLTAIKTLGVRLSIDDFGTGYSSLAQLKRFPIDTLKIDRSFIRDIPGNAEDKAITEAIIAMGKTLGVTTLAEGVETAAQRAFLKSRECDEMQGFHFSRPAHPDHFAHLLRKQHALPRTGASLSAAAQH